MTPTDIADVSGATYTYLINGHAPAANWTGIVPAAANGCACVLSTARR